MSEQTVEIENVLKYMREAIGTMAQEIAVLKSMLENKGNE